MVCITKTYLLSVIIIFLIFGRWIRLVESSRILAIETAPGKSHWNFMSSVLRALTDNGHHVTVFTPFIDGNHENYTEIDMSVELPRLLNISLTESIQLFGDPIALVRTSPSKSRLYCDILHGNDQMKQILEGTVNTSFDIVLIEPVWSDCISYLVKKLNLPMIYVMPYPMVNFLERSINGEIPNPSSVSSVLSRHTAPKTFVQRFTNTALLVYGMVTLNINQRRLKYIEPKPYDISTPVSPSALFINSHYISEASRPTHQNVIPIGGIHLKPAQTVPSDILEFIEDSPHGVIYITFGSVISMSTLSETIQNSFKEALAQVPQKVLWKYEGDMKNKPKNVMSRKWFPQRDILLHPNVKLFISHGGISGVYEAVDAGVPVLGFPQFFDQPRNIEHLVDAGMAISMDLFTMKTDIFLKNILELTNNKKYMENAKIVSDRFKDRPISPAEQVVYWTEYVIRHKGAPHLKSHALNLTWYQYLLLDVIALLIVLVLLFIFITYKMFKIVCKMYSKYFQLNKAKSE